MGKLYLFEWLGLLIVADDQDAAMGIIENIAHERTEIVSTPDALDRFASQRVHGAELPAPVRWYLRAVDPNEVVELPLRAFDERRRCAIAGATERVMYAGLFWSGYAWEAADFLPNKWTFDTHEEP